MDTGYSIPMTGTPTAIGSPEASILESGGIGLLWIIFAVVFLVFLGHAAILTYHWVKFSINDAKSTLTFTVYAVVSGVLLFIMFSSLNALSI